MKNAFVFITLCLIFKGVTAQNADSIWILNNYTKIERQIPMRDGIKLFTSIYVPKDISTDHPVLMERTPYSCRPYGEDNWSPFWHSYLKTYFRERYIMVRQDVRGRWMSEGVFADVRPFNPDKKTN